MFYQRHKVSLATPELRWTPFVTLLKKEIVRFLKVINQTVVTPLMNSSLYLLIFGVSLGRSIDLSSGVSYLAFLIPGLVTMSMLNNAFQNSSSSVLNSKFHGDIIDFKIAPFSTHQVVWALSLGALIRGFAVGAVTIGVSEVFHLVVKGSFLGIQHPLIFIYYLFVGTMTFASFGIIVGFWAKNFEQVNAIGGFILLPLIYLGGVFYSLENLHPFWRIVSQGNPLLYFINGIRYGVIGVSDVNIWTAFGVSVGSMIAMYLLSIRSVKTGSYIRW